MTRSASLTVRLPGASTAPATRTRTCFQTGAVKQSRKAVNQVASTGGATAGPAAGERCVVIASVESSRAGSARVLDRPPPIHADAAAQPTRRQEFAEKPIMRHGNRHRLRSSRCPDRPNCGKSSSERRHCMETMIARCCGLDVHQGSVVACVVITEARRKLRREIRTFGTMTKDLEAL